MKDMNIRIPSRGPHIPAQMLDSVRELNHRFLDLVSRDPAGWNVQLRGLPHAALLRVMPLSAAQKAAASTCPYALFDMRFHDAAHWRPRLMSAACGSVAESPTDAETLEFVRLALFFAWHVAATTHIGARLLLGMSEASCAAFRSATIDCLPSVAAAQSGLLTARWNNCARYWTALAAAASTPNAAGLRRIQLYGLQLAAAARLV
jgi:hypothetical protein